MIPYKLSNRIANMLCRKFISISHRYQNFPSCWFRFSSLLGLLIPFLCILGRMQCILPGRKHVSYRIRTVAVVQDVSVSSMAFRDGRCKILNPIMIHRQTSVHRHTSKRHVQDLRGTSCHFFDLYGHGRRPSNNSYVAAGDCDHVAVVGGDIAVAVLHSQSVVKPSGRFHLRQ